MQRELEQARQTVSALEGIGAGAPPDPADAAARGELVIADRALEAPFWRYDTDDARHSFYRRGSAELAQVFATPPWQAPRETAPPR